MLIIESFLKSLVTLTKEPSVAKIYNQNATTSNPIEANSSKAQLANKQNIVSELPPSRVVQTVAARLRKIHEA